MNHLFLERLNLAVKDINKSYYKQIYVYEFLKGNTVKYFSEIERYSYISLNLELSIKLKDIPPARRPFKIAECLSDLVNDAGSNIICLDYFELLFEPSLKVNPFDLFKNLSKNKTLIIAWRGVIKDSHFIHADPGHPEYRKYPTNDAIIIK